MARFCGSIGFAFTKEISPGVWQDEIIERTYYGDILRNRRRWTSGSGANDNLNIVNELSIVADPFASDNLTHLVYVNYRGSRWKIDTVEIEYPRIKIEMGGVYNGDTPNAAQ